MSFSRPRPPLQLTVVVGLCAAGAVHEYCRSLRANLELLDEKSHRNVSKCCMYVCMGVRYFMTTKLCSRNSFEPPMNVRLLRDVLLFECGYLTAFLASCPNIKPRKNVRVLLLLLFIFLLTHVCENGAKSQRCI